MIYAIMGYKRVWDPKQTGEWKTFCLRCCGEYGWFGAFYLLSLLFYTAFTLVLMSSRLGPAGIERQESPIAWVELIQNKGRDKVGL